MLAHRVEHAPAEHERTQVGERSGHEVPTEYQDSTLQVRDSRQIWTGVLSDRVGEDGGGPWRHRRWGRVMVIVGDAASDRVLTSTNHV